MKVRNALPQDVKRAVDRVQARTVQQLELPPMPVVVGADRALIDDADHLVRLVHRLDRNSPPIGLHTHRAAIQGDSVALDERASDRRRVVRGGAFLRDKRLELALERRDVRPLLRVGQLLVEPDEGQIRAPVLQRCSEPNGLGTDEGAFGVGHQMQLGVGRQRLGDQREMREHPIASAHSPLCACRRAVRLHVRVVDEQPRRTGPEAATRSNRRRRSPRCDHLLRRL